MLKVGVVQQVGIEDKTESISQLISNIRKAAEKGAELVLLQELHNGLYFCQREDSAYFEFAESIPGPTTNELCKIAKELNIVIVGSIFEKRAPGIYHNTAVVFERDGSIAGIYRKMHIPDGPGYHEKFYFTPGDLGFKPIKTSVGVLGILICLDQWFPEAARLMALAGAEILLYPTAIGWDTQDSDDEKQRQIDAWITCQRGHAIANTLPIVVCNRVGFEKDSLNDTGIDFWGASFVAGPQGEIFAKASSTQPELLVTEIDLNRRECVHRVWNLLRDRRIDAYGGLLRIYREGAHNNFTN